MDLTLTPFWATLIFVAACVAGHQYRRVWKNEGPLWQLWVFGLFAAIALTVLGFVPMKTVMS